MIGSVPYRIEYSSPVVSDEKDKVLWGEILQGKQLIKVDAEIGPEMQRVVLLHEIIHGLLLHCGLSQHEEAIAERLGYALDSFLQGNPEFVRLYNEKPSKGRIQEFVSFAGSPISIHRKSEGDNE